MPSPLITRLAERPLLCDGAMGTMLYARGVPLDACFDVLNLNEPKMVQSIHAEYIQAGSDLIETNTFGANRFKLAPHGLQGRVREINLRGVKLARDVRESMGRDVLVVGSIGPLGKYLAPLGSIEPDEARVVKAQADIRQLESALEMYKLDNFYYPSTQQGLEALVTKPSGDPPAKNWRDGYITRASDKADDLRKAARTGSPPSASSNSSAITANGGNHTAAER